MANSRKRIIWFGLVIRPRHHQLYPAFRYTADMTSKMDQHSELRSKNVGALIEIHVTRPENVEMLLVYFNGWPTLYRFMLVALLSFSIWVVLCLPSNVCCLAHVQNEMTLNDRWTFRAVLQVTFPIFYFLRLCTMR